MQSAAAIVLALASVLSTAAGHGVIVSPPPRMPGAAYEAACGLTIYNNQKADPAGPVELLMQSAGSIVDAEACNMWLCKGYQFSDNDANVQTYARGETIPMRVDIRAPHTGYANVSIVDTASNSVVGTALRSWTSYASTATGVGAGETAFDITIPTDLDGCSSPGDCVIQWFWYSPPGVDQTYEGCIDFVVPGSAGTSKTLPATTYTTSAARTTSSIPTSVYTTTAIPTSVYPTTAIPTLLYTNTTIPISMYKVAAIPTLLYTPAAIPTSVYKPTAIPTSVYKPAAIPTSLYKPAAIPTSMYTNTTIPTLLYTPTAIPTSLYKPAAIPTSLYTPAAIPTSMYPTTSVPTPVYMTTAIPTPSTLTTRTRMMATTKPLPCATKTPQSISRCLEGVNACIRGMRSYNGGAIDFSVCEAQRAACY